MEVRRSIGIARLIVGIIIIILILISAFFLMRAYPGNDPRLRSMDTEHFYGDPSSIITRYHWDMPPFYFSIRPSFLGRNYYKIYEGRNEYKDAAILLKPTHILSTLWLRINEKYDHKHELYNQLAIGEIRDLKLDSEDKILLEQLSFRNSGSEGLLPKFYWYGSENQFALWMKNAFNLQSSSLYDGIPIGRKIIKALKWTIIIQLPAFIITFFGGMILGILFKLYPQSLHFLKFSLFGIYAIPLFALGTVILLIAYHYFSPEFWSIRPIQLSGSESYIDILSQHLKVLILPWLTIVLHQIIYVSRQMEATLSREMNRRYILVAKSLGDTRVEALKKHAIGNALTPMITIGVLMIPAIFSGSIVIETIFNIPGIGRLFLSSIMNGEWGLCLLLICISSVITYFAMWLGDIIYYKRIEKSDG